MTRRIVVVGGGFGGVKCARSLRKQLPEKEFQIVVFNRENHMVFHPLLAEVVSASVQPQDVGAPLRQLLRAVQCRTEDVKNIEFAEKKVLFESHDGQIRSMTYDYLVLTCGNTVNLALVPGMDEHAFPLKTIGDALTLQSHIMEQLERAEVCENFERKRWYLRFVIVGGGFSGVEVAGEINDLLRSSLKFFQNIGKDDIEVLIVHSRDEILPEVSPKLREFAKCKMEEAGVKIILNRRATMATPEGIRLEDGTFLHAATVVCTIGTTTQMLVQRLDAEKEGGRLLTEADMRLKGKENVWAFGDCASVVNSLDGELCPPVAQFAERQGIQAADNIVAATKGKESKPFAFKMQGQLCSIGGRSAVAEIFGLRLAGFLAWFCWRGIYLVKLPSFAQVMKVGIEWFCDLIFPRTLAHLRADRSRHIGRAYFAPGDHIYHVGDSATDFFVIEKGEVEILQCKDKRIECIATLATGDFFGESSLLESTTRQHSVRCKTDVICTVLGRNVFTQISSSLVPVRDAVAKAARKRRSMWQNIPEVKDILDAVPIEQLLDPLPMETLNISDSVETMLEKMNEHGADFCCIVDENKSLRGVVTRTDLLKAVEIASLADPDQDLPVTDIMTRNPVSISLHEPLAVAMSTMRDNDLKQLPVVDGKKSLRVIGRLRIERVVAYVLSQTLSRRQREASS